MTSPYDILGITPEATADEIKTAYRELSKKHHPDMPEGDEDKFLEIKNAYDVLTDPQKKRMWDDLGVMPGTPEFDIISEATNYIAFCFAKLIHEIDLDAFKSQPLIKVLVDISKKEQHKHEQEIKTFEQAKERCHRALEIVRKQCRKKKADSPNIFIKVLEGKLQEVEQLMIPARRTIEVMKKAQELLNEYEFTQEMPMMLQQMNQQMQQYQPGFQIYGATHY